MRSLSQDEPFLLVTIPQSHFCEKARWALDRLNARYEEERHLPMLHLPATLLRGGKRTTPLLKTRAGVFDDSTDILHYLDGFLETDKKLFPVENPARAAVEQLENHFDEILGPATRLWVYTHLLPNKELSLTIVEHSVPRYQALIGKAMFGVVRGMMAWRLDMKAGAEVSSLKDIHTIFDEVAERLADGRRYLIADRFTAADLTFASLAAVLLLPPEYGGPLPTPEMCPPAMKKLVEELRAHPAGQYGLRLFREERPRKHTDES
ncbi:MAG TPA: glutathione S-transferase family protein [Polyangium sp.]|nr:glutathione S-transferase family protein [Polyangium sp.]